MSDTIIKAEDVGKLYRLGEIGTGTISHDLNRWFARVRGKEDPFAKVGEVNDRTTKGSSGYVWALKDVCFEVKAGEVLGIIGRNGAGKSTLLKILSKVTAPTVGTIKVKGRIASLLEVGTGFHAELTGRENVFMNGAILGMTKGEIKKKFDEIVDFSGVERYIDTPVKRYSSGMYVRLAFAVAAFLEPEILIVDEVLAVGDAEFQKKCLGRMKDVSVNDGRTVLFVSHNMGSIADLCERGLFMQNGTVRETGPIEAVVKSYLNSNANEFSYTAAGKGDRPHIAEIFFRKGGNESGNLFGYNEAINIFIRLQNLQRSRKNTQVSLIVHNKLEIPIFSNHYHTGNTQNELLVNAEIPANLLLPDTYYLKVVLHEPYVEFIDQSPPLILFEVEDTGNNEYSLYKNANIGMINSNTSWKVVS